MGFPLIPFISGGANLAGEIIGNRSRSKEAKKDRAFQERMRNTSWQAGVEDLKKAGLNPALAYSQGGAAQPGGAMAQQSDVISGAVSSAQHARRLQSELRLMNTQEIKAYEEAKLSKTMAGESAARTQLTYRNQKAVELENQLRSLNMFSARNTARVEQTMFGQKASFADRIRRMIFGGSSIFSPVGVRR